MPWMWPLHKVECIQFSNTWSARHCGLSTAAAANGLWPPSRLHEAGIVDTSACLICGDECSLFYRYFKCPGRASVRQQSGISETIFAAACRFPHWPLWTRLLAPDPTRCLPPPVPDCFVEWTIIPEDGQRVFRGSVYGDGSCTMPFERWSARCGWGVVRVRIDGASIMPIACALGPLPGPIQSTPVAETFALLQFAPSCCRSAGHDLPL